MKKFPTLYKKDSKGNLHMWEISVIGVGDIAVFPAIYILYGRVGGKIQETIDIIREGKNIGKNNQTCPDNQAYLEAESKWTKQQERKGYVLTPEATLEDQRVGVDPMLAHRFDKFADKLTFPCYIQPKMDGHRCIAIVENGIAKLFSRNRVQITGLPHIEKGLVEFVGNNLQKVIFDGELYNHDFKTRFEELTSFIRSKEPKQGNEIIQYHIYDLIMKDISYNNRFTILKNIKDSKTSKSNDIVLVQTELISSENDITDWFEIFLQQGYEGSMLRNYNSLYKNGRSYDLLKVKTFEDDEFKIVGVEEGRGKLAGHAIMICETDSGKEFNVKLKGKTEKLKEYWENPNIVFGKKLTVQFQGKSIYGIPRFPIGLRIKEDL